MKRLVPALLLVLVSVGSCSSGQDPGISPDATSGPTTTSRTLEPCPDGGPDETTSPAGCLDEDGNVLRP